MDIIMAVDESITSTGVAIFKGTEFITTYRIRPDKKQSVLERMEYLRSSLADIVKRHAVSVFVVEDIYESRKKNSVLSFRYNLFIQGMLFDMSKKRKDSIYALYNASQWRNILGMKTADIRENSKQEARDYVAKQLGLFTTCDDEADAICIGLAYIKEWT